MFVPGFGTVHADSKDLADKTKISAEVLPIQTLRCEA
jgi:hypothetical protein